MMPDKPPPAPGSGAEAEEVAGAEEEDGAACSLAGAGGGAAALLRPWAAELLPADGTRAVQLQPGHDAARVEAVPALQQPHLLALR